MSLPPVVRPALSFDDFDEHPVSHLHLALYLWRHRKNSNSIVYSLHSPVCSIICGTPKVGLILLHSAFATVRESGVELGNTSIHMENASIITKQYSSPLALLNWI